jgi:hypothetical protein
MEEGIEGRWKGNMHKRRLSLLLLSLSYSSLSILIRTLNFHSLSAKKIVHTYYVGLLSSFLSCLYCDGLSPLGKS